MLDKLISLHKEPLFEIGFTGRANFAQAHQKKVDETSSQSPTLGFGRVHKASQGVLTPNKIYSPWT